MIKVSGYELNLHTIMNSGQCFRIFEVKEHEYEVLSGNYAVHVIYEPSSNYYLFDCPDHEWKYWENYLDLQTDYQQFYKVIMQSDDDFLKSAMAYGEGMRILRQDFWEVLVSFIISQNNNIPRIKKSIEALCKRFGREILYQDRVYYTFPCKSELQYTTLEDLSDLGLGYRAAYLYDLFHCDSTQIKPDYQTLLSMRGIGKKVASCIMLFGAHDLSQFPIDTWMKKLIENIYHGEFDPTPYQGFEGFIQQLQFYYYRSMKGK